MTKKRIPHSPFDDYGDISKKNDEETQKLVIAVTRENEAENEQNMPHISNDFLPINPYKNSIITKKATLLGRGNHAYSLSFELVLRIKMLAARITHENILSGKKKRCTESELIEQGMRAVLKRNRYKYNDLEFYKDDVAQ